ncbi:MAG: hypothetical protein EBT40_01615, partial [Betaproteobacteria bacterium]|nr:hypothetical protein [Betaproteobacteria bacterium]
MLLPVWRAAHALISTAMALRGALTTSGLPLMTASLTGSGKLASVQSTGRPSVAANFSGGRSQRRDTRFSTTSSRSGSRPSRSHSRTIWVVRLSDGTVGVDTTAMRSSWFIRLAATGLMPEPRSSTTQLKASDKRRISRSRCCGVTAEKRSKARSDGTNCRLRPRSA